MQEPSPDGSINVPIIVLSPTAWDDGSPITDPLKDIKNIGIQGNAILKNGTTEPWGTAYPDPTSYPFSTAVDVRVVNVMAYQIVALGWEGDIGVSKMVTMSWISIDPLPGVIEHGGATFFSQEYVDGMTPPQAPTVGEPKKK